MRIKIFKQVRIIFQFDELPCDAFPIVMIVKNDLCAVIVSCIMYSDILASTDVLDSISIRIIPFLFDVFINSRSKDYG